MPLGSSFSFEYARVSNDKWFLCKSALLRSDAHPNTCFFFHGMNDDSFSLNLHSMAIESHVRLEINTRAELQINCAMDNWNVAAFRITQRGEQINFVVLETWNGLNCSFLTVFWQLAFRWNSFSRCFFLCAEILYSPVIRMRAYTENKKKCAAELSRNKRQRTLYALRIVVAYAQPTCKRNWMKSVFFCLLCINSIRLLAVWTRYDLPRPMWMVPPQLLHCTRSSLPSGSCTRAQSPRLIMHFLLVCLSISRTTSPTPTFANTQEWNYERARAKKKK